ncbi:hypothetical protein AB6A40_005115 [Gnathostoma spinigerum]|uniref:F-box domain-containing protein n=1 Tax=Gnathostoma spinigerum TaxID=75299 RepID=A0ABD6EGS2_9BILA
MEYLFNKIPPHLIKKICQRCENASDILSLERAYPDLNSVLRTVFWTQIRTLTILDDEHHGSSMWISTRDDLSYGVEWTTDVIKDVLTRSCELHSFHLLCDSARNETMSAFIVDILLSTEDLQLTSILLGLPSTSKFAFRTESHGEWPSRSLLKCLVKLVDQQKSTLRHFLILSAQSHLLRFIRGENNKLNTEFVGYCDPLIYSVFHYPLIRAFSDG